LSRSGTLAYQQGSRDAQVALVDTAGNEKIVITEPRRYTTPRFSPYGRRIALSIIGSPSMDVWIYDIGSATPSRLTTQGDNDRAELTPDGKRVLFRSTRHLAGGGTDNIWWQPADASAPAEPLITLKNGSQEAVMSRDGKWLVFRNNGAATLRDIYYRQLRGDTAVHPLATSQFDEIEPRLSPNAEWVAYAADESGTWEIYARPFPGLTTKTKISVDGGTEPVWAPDARTVYYWNQNQLIAASVDAGPDRSLVVTKRRVVFSGDYLLSGIHANYDVSPDGRSFLVLKHVGEESQLVVVHNWRNELRDRAGRR